MNPSVLRDFYAAGRNVIRVTRGRFLGLPDADQPTAAEAFRGAMFVDQGGAGVADVLKVCLKDSADAYAWQSGAMSAGSGIFLGPWYADNLAGTAADRVFALMVMATTTSVAQPAVNPGNELYMPRAGRIVGAFLNSAAARTAGTATLRVSISGGTSAFASGACVLDGTNTVHIAAWDEGGPTFTAGQYIRPVITTASWTPTTADVTAWLVVRFTP